MRDRFRWQEGLTAWAPARRGAGGFGVADVGFFVAFAG